MVEVAIETIDAFVDVFGSGSVENLTDVVRDVVIDSASGAGGSVENLMDLVKSVDEVPTEPEPENVFPWDWVAIGTLFIMVGGGTYWASQFLEDGQLPPPTI